MAVIRQRGDRWQAIVRVTVAGAKYHETRSFASKPLASSWADRLEAHIKVNGVPQRALTVLTLAELIAQYTEAVGANATLRRQRVHELAQLEREFTGVKLNRLTAKTFVDFARKRAAEGAGPVTINHNLATLSSVLAAARPVLGVEITSKPVTDAIDALRRTRAITPSSQRHRRVSDDEIGALVREFERVASLPSTLIPMAAIIPLAVALPRRLGELTSMLWDDFKGTTALLRDTKHPTRPRDEVVPVPPKARTMIEALPRIDAKILPYNPESVSAAFERACKRLNIHDLRFHDLRHEGISRLFEAGLGIQEVALVSGHTSWATLKRYTHLNALQVVEKLKGAPCS